MKKKEKKDSKSEEENNIDGATQTQRNQNYYE